VGLLNPSIIFLCRGFESHSFFKLIMNFDMILFYFISISLLFSSLLIVLEINSVYSILLLVLAFVLASSLLLLLECEFMALIFVIIYVGAISVLFLFVIIMLNLKTTNSLKDLVKYLPTNNFLALVFSLEILIIILESFKPNYYFNSLLFNFNVNWLYKLDYITDLKALGQILYTHYVFQFLIVGMILLIAIIGAVALTFNPKICYGTTQNPFRQVSR
jgi:NADH-quinone oxidoreductase subunit J